jgi:hypothetical protein
MKILDVSAGNRAVWFDKQHRDCTYVDIRPEVNPTVVADATMLPAEVNGPFNLVVFDPPHKNNGAESGMTRSYGHWTANQITAIVIGTAREAYRVTAPDALMAFKWAEHTRKLASVLKLLAPWWEPLFGHGVSHQQRGTSWVMLRRRTKIFPWET